MHAQIKPVAVCALAATLLLAGGSLASLNGDLHAYNDGVTNWTGIVRYQGLVFPGSAFERLDWAADVEYCVYAPGDFQLSFPGQDPSLGTEYVYAYQIFNDLDPYPTTPTWWDGAHGHLNAFSVAIDGDEQAHNDHHFNDPAQVPPPPQVDPSSHTIVGTSAFFGFADASQLDYGEVSEILIFTSPFTPEEDDAGLSGVRGESHLLPSPSNVPEPATLGLLLLGSALIFSARRP